MSHSEAAIDCTYPENLRYDKSSCLFGEIAEFNPDLRTGIDKVVHDALNHMTTRLAHHTKIASRRTHRLIPPISL